MTDDSIQEFKSLDSDANIYKLVGPVLLKQDKSEAVMAVEGRLNFIEKEMFVSLPLVTLLVCAKADWGIVNGSRRRLKKLMRRARRRGQRYAFLIWMKFPVLILSRFCSYRRRPRLRRRRVLE